MGCDIHAIVEYRENASAPWRRLDGDLPDPLDDRDYHVFSVLADVRNYDGLPCIDEPRGLPDDFVPLGRDVSDCWIDDDPENDPDLHSLSWVSLADLEQFDWSATISGSLLVREGDYLAWRNAGRKQPDTGCRGTNAPTYSEAEYRAGEATGQFPTEHATERGIFARGPHVRVVWTETLADVVPRLANDLPAALRKLGDPNDVRVVFGFDN